MPLSSLSVRRLCLYFVLTLFSTAPICRALIIPFMPTNLVSASPESLSTPSAAPDISPRATLVMGMEPALLEEQSTDGELLPIENVLQTMLDQPPPSPSIATPAPIPTTHSASPASSVDLAETLTPSLVGTGISPTASPPKQGPGIVLVTTPLPELTRTASSAEPNSTSSPIVDDALNRSVPSSNRMLILGCIIGGIACVTLILFFMLDPSISGMLCGFCRFRPFKRPKPERGISNVGNSAFSTENLHAHGSSEHSFIGMHDRKPLPASEKRGEDTLVEVDLNAPPTSKFSICSSAYLGTSTRNSSVTSTSISVSTRPARPLTVTFAPPATSPTRPPRPPTADSPMLSDSVYFACERQPYVVTSRPQGSKTDSRGAPKKNLTPSEFFALHVPAILSTLIGKSEGSSRDCSVSAISTRRSSGSQHSRTKSAPLLGLGQSWKRGSKFPATIEEGNEEVPVPKTGPIALRVQRHRRSRSASGWAYPDRPRVRKMVNV